MNIGFIIPVYKQPEQVEKCIKAIEAMETDHDVTVFKYDNNETNVGFTKAINVGLVNYLDGMTDYCVVLNQDCYVKPDFVDKLVDFMESHPRCAIDGAKQLMDSNQDIIIHGGCTTAFPEGRHIVGKVSLGGCEKNKRMPWVNGACMIVNMNLISRYGIMDENYFLIGSDSVWQYSTNQNHSQYG